MVERGPVGSEVEGECGVKFDDVGENRSASSGSLIIDDLMFTF